VAASASPGDVVLLQGVLLQLWAPLQFLGWFYREVRQSLVDMEEFFDILKTQNNLPSGTVVLPDLPPSLASSFQQPPAAAAAAAANGHGHPNGNRAPLAPAAAAAAGDVNAAALQERLLSHSHASSSSSSSSGHFDQQDLVEAALLLEEQQHPQHHQQHSAQHLHNLGSSDHEVGRPDRSVAISGLGLEVELEDVRFGYQPERQVSVCGWVGEGRGGLCLWGHTVCVGQLIDTCSTLPPELQCY
jgi:ABC-type multidrug transport system fused ATPase/permease subunit